jgi:hypothetical protein
MNELVLWMAGAIAGGGEALPGGLVELLMLGAGIVLATVVTTGTNRHVEARREVDPSGKSHRYTLAYGDETVTLEPGKTWVRTDTYKWVTRGLIEEPQSFQVLANGTVDINAERIAPDDPEGETKLESQINKHHPPSLAHKPPVIPVNLADLEDLETGKVRFRVRLDHLGHMMIECTRGRERVETGLRGLPTLAQGGFMIKPSSLHVDPLQRAVELDGARFDCSADGARQFEELLNQRYAPTLKADDTTQIAVRENSASATGFDIDFVTVQAGARQHVKGHLSQEKLNVLQDHQRCDLLHPGIILRISPPHLLIRRRRPDGGEEPIPELPDIHYLRTEAVQLQQILNHPLVRRRADASEAPPPQATTQSRSGVATIRVTRNPQTRLFLWLECQHAGGRKEGKAFTHHNVADLQHRHLFQDHFDVSLSIDNHRLSILDRRDQSERVVTLNPSSDDSDLAQATEMLTAALKPVQVRAP